MPEIEIYDYLDVVAPDKDLTLTLKGNGGIFLEEDISGIDAIHTSPDGAYESRLDFSGGKIRAFLTIPYSNILAADRGTLMQYYCDPNYGNKRINSFKLEYSDGHTYTVRFHNPSFKCQWRGRLYATICVFKILGKPS